jgi:putative transposase
MLTRVLRREGFADNHKRIYRIYREEGLQVPKRRKRKTNQWRGKRPLATTGLYQGWSIDFVSDQLADGRKLRMLTVVADFSRQSLAIAVDTSLSGYRVCRVLDRLVLQHGHPQRIVMDNGPEFTGKALDQWAYEQRVELQFIEPDKPVQNAFVESCNGTLRKEGLNEHWFISLAEAKRLVEDWRLDYNHHRPHSSLGDQAPAEFAILRSPWGAQTVPINNNLTTESSHND